MQPDHLNLKFKGRVAKRKDSQKKRDAILNAALRIIVRDGIRDVRHRSVAKEAKVSLSATTYYFDDIESLVHDAYLFFVQQSIHEIDTLEQHALNALEHFQRNQNSEELKSNLKKLLLTHVKAQTDNHDARVIEWSFRQQALRDDKLAAALYTPQKMMLTALEQFFIAFNHNEKHASAKANIMMGTLLQLEYQLLMSQHSGMTLAKAKHAIDTLLDETMFIHKGELAI
ncbi:TetR/AcrR family transcriptional regulator [Neptunicella sp. SCSIO 80796]|uniref:TetR/AcrR family transcriptional regulator n=1 Tax=Neptunicella plasticusilytica TaxID=3117012 RepID=UPI003A4DAEE7